jgi:hypothetical protein
MVTPTGRPGNRESVFLAFQAEKCKGKDLLQQF